jgi:hypothetical protein
LVLDQEDESDVNDPLEFIENTENDAVVAYDDDTAKEEDIALLAVPCKEPVAGPNKFEELSDDEAQEADITDPDAAI